MKKPASAFKFPNGNIAVCDSGGQQISEYQGTWSVSLEKKIRKDALPDCEYLGF